VLGAEFWVYDSIIHTCYLYSSNNRNCDRLSGPWTPTMRECQSTTTTNIVNTTTTDTAITTTTNTAVTTTIRTTTTARATTTILSTTTSSHPNDDFSEVILFEGGSSDIIFVSENSWCSLPDIFPFPSNTLYHLLAVHYGHQLIACMADGPRYCFLNEKLAEGEPWQKIATKALSGFGSTYAVVGSTLIVSNGGGFFDTNVENTLFEILDLAQEDAEWVTVNLNTPNIPQGSPLIQSCMVAVNESSFILIGGQINSEDYQMVGSLTQIYNLETGEWTRMPDLEPHRESHACMRYQDGILLTGGFKRDSSCCGWWMLIFSI